MKTRTLDKAQRIKVDAAWATYDAMQKCGDVQSHQVRDQIEEYLFQLGVLEGLTRVRDQIEEYLFQLGVLEGLRRADASL